MLTTKEVKIATTRETIAIGETIVLEALTIGVSTIRTSTRSILKLLDGSLLNGNIGTDLSYIIAIFTLLVTMKIPSGAITY